VLVSTAPDLLLRVRAEAGTFSLSIIGSQASRVASKLLTDVARADHVSSTAKRWQNLAPFAQIRVGEDTRAEWRCVLKGPADQRTMPVAPAGTS
jgi:hypothetical protein